MYSQESLDFLKKIAYDFNSPELFLEAITHPSVTTKSNIKFNYDRLEFLGDKVLSMVIAEALMAKFRNESEGDLSRRQAHLVSGEVLWQIASKLEIEKILIVSKGEENIGGKNNKNNLENALEAIIGAIYLDSCYETVKKFILNFWKFFLDKNLEPPQDSVSKLQEVVQERSKQLPTYKIDRCGGDEHNPSFEATLTIEYLNLSFSAIGKSKKEAQRNVAIIALEKISHLC